MTRELEENEKYYTIFKVIATFIIYLFIGIFALFTIFVSKVKADSSPVYWYDGFNTPLYGQYYRWTSASANSNQTTETFNIGRRATGINGTAGDSITAIGQGFKNTNNFTITNYGLTIRITTNETMKSNYLYSWQVGLCSDTSLNNVSFSKISYTLSGTEQYTYGTKINVSNSPTDGNTYSSCKIFSGLVSGESGSNNLYLKVIASTNTSSSAYYTIGYKVQELGMWDENLRSIMQSVISSSGLATASSVQQVQEATEQVQQQVEEVNEQQQETNNMLNDDSVDNPNDSINGMASNNTSNGVISDLLLLPVRLYQALINNINGTCTTFNLGSLFGHNLVMPCINISSFLGSAIYGTIDVFISGFFILTIRKKFVDIFNNITSLKTGGNELE